MVSNDVGMGAEEEDDADAGGRPMDADIANADDEDDDGAAAGIPGAPTVLVALSSVGLFIAGVADDSRGTPPLLLLLLSRPRLFRWPMRCPV